MQIYNFELREEEYIEAALYTNNSYLRGEVRVARFDAKPFELY